MPDAAANPLAAFARGAETAVAAFAFLKINQGFEKFRAGKIRPESFGDVNFGVGDLPEQKIADAHFAAGADEQVGIGEAGGIEMLGDGLFVGLERGHAVGADLVEHGVEGVYQFGAAAVIQGDD